MQNANMGRWFEKTGTAIVLAATAISLCCHRVKAAEKVIFTYESATQAVSISELQSFAATGEISPSLKFLLNVGKQSPWMMRWILNQNFPADTEIVSDLFNTAPGEYVLSQTSTVVSSKSERANVKALRGALIASASDDRQISLIELLENYPTKQVFVNGKLLAKMRPNFVQFVEETSK